jgi:carotenoid cleavage dioxygenase
MPFGVNTDEMMKAGGDYWRLISDRPSEFLVSPRNENAPNHPDWNPGEFKYTAPPGLIIHSGKAWEECWGITVLLCRIHSDHLEMLGAGGKEVLSCFILSEF